MEQRAENWDVYTVPSSTTVGHTKDHWFNWWDEPYTLHRPNLANPIWPLAIHGTKIRNLDGVCDLAIVTNPDITIWAFALNSQAKVWQIAR